MNGEADVAEHCAAAEADIQVFYAKFKTGHQ